MQVQGGLCLCWLTIAQLPLMRQRRDVIKWSPAPGSRRQGGRGQFSRIRWSQEFLWSGNKAGGETFIAYTTTSTRQPRLWARHSSVSVYSIPPELASFVHSVGARDAGDDDDCRCEELCSPMKLRSLIWYCNIGAPSYILCLTFTQVKMNNCSLNTFHLKF